MAKGYGNEHALLDAIIAHKKLRNDADLAREMRYKPGVISKVRNQRVEISEEFRIRVMRVTGWSLKKVDELAPLDAHPDSDGPRD